ncbi:MAG: DNA repair protein RadA [Endomicrobiaceae bacterium]|nr:DNA repair protein RadA [Endomicrobiaceae bacterium]
MKAKKIRTVFVCQSCGYESAKWLGRCPGCSNWNTFVEEKQNESNLSDSQNFRQLTGFSSGTFALNDVSVKSFERVKTGISEFDNMIGGGIVPGSLILLGGAPGIGKSTLMLQVSSALSQNGTVLYISGEESLSQVKSRAERLKVSKGNIFLASETNLENIIDAINKTEPAFLVIDSIQTTYHPEFTSAPGSVGQIRECSAELLRIAKSKHITVFLLGHVTKDGDLAGPRILEHIVDTVLYFENEKQQVYRILRAYKNRFGPTSEIGIFEMKGDGLSEVENPSLIFIGERSNNVAGNIITSSMEGTRPLLLEIQSLVSRTNFGFPRRMVSGYDLNRITIIIAVLEKRIGIPLENQDVFVNVAGGIKIKETAADLAIACAVASANGNFICPPKTIVFGEVGLTGEVRAVGQIKERLAESEKLGFRKAIIPKANMRSLDYKGKLEVAGVDNVSSAISSIRQ